MRARSSESGRRGVSLILTAAVLCTILPIIGLAIDVSLLYSTKARLSAAVDAAALAGARSLNRGMSLAAQTDAAQATAIKFFNANFPTGAMRTSNRVVTPAVGETGYRTRTVSIDASVDAPTYFLRMLGFTSTRLRATGMASRRDANLVLVLDRSGSMAGAMAPMIAAARGFVGRFAEGRDNVGLFVFSGTTIVAFPDPSPSPTSRPPARAWIRS